MRVQAPLTLCSASILTLHPRSRQSYHSNRRACHGPSNPSRSHLGTLHPIISGNVATFCTFKSQPMKASNIRSHLPSLAFSSVDPPATSLTLSRDQHPRIIARIHCCPSLPYSRHRSVRHLRSFKKSTTRKTSSPPFPLRTPFPRIHGWSRLHLPPSASISLTRREPKKHI